ncbi:MAG: iron-sulfur cluster assembly accessory protein [Ideonella sp.]|nr:iron-sulfur cluster assembly accessory protein [Ideonella sp.]
MFTLTPAAAAQIRQAASRSAAEDLALRIAARQAADGGIEYGMGFDEAQEADMRLLIEGVAIVIAGAHQPLLENTQLDYVELEPDAFSFIFVPDAGRSSPAPEAAGCGGGACGSCGG